MVHDRVNSSPVSCVYRAYERGTLVATGRLMLDALPEAGDQVMLNGRSHVVRSVEFGSGEHVLELEPIELTPG